MGFLTSFSTVPHSSISSLPTSHLPFPLPQIRPLPQPTIARLPMRQPANLRPRRHQTIISQRLLRPPLTLADRKQPVSQVSRTLTLSTCLAQDITDSYLTSPSEQR